MWGGQRCGERPDLPPCWGAGRGPGSWVAVGGVGTVGTARSGHPVWAVGVFIPTVHPWQGLTPPSPQQVLPPHWQLWPCPCHQGHSHCCAQWVQTQRTPGGTDPTHSCPLPLLSESKSLLLTSIPWSPVQPRQWPAPLCPRRARWSLLVSPLHGGSASSQGDPVPPLPSLQRSPRHFTRCSRWWR